MRKSEVVGSQIVEDIVGHAKDFGYYQRQMEATEMLNRRMISSEL